MYSFNNFIYFFVFLFISGAASIASAVKGGETVSQSECEARANIDGNKFHGEYQESEAESNKVFKEYPDIRIYERRDTADKHLLSDLIKSWISKGPRSLVVGYNLPASFLGGVDQVKRPPEKIVVKTQYTGNEEHKLRVDRGETFINECAFYESIDKTCSKEGRTPPVA